MSSYRTQVRCSNDVLFTYCFASLFAVSADASPVKEPLQAASDLPKAHSDAPAPSQEEDKAKSGENPTAVCSV